MGDMNHKPIKPAQDQRGDELEQMLDAALAKYAAVEPRAGLEERVLANLRSEQLPTPNRAWWQWSLVAAVAAVLIVAVTLAWRSKTTHPHLANHPPAGVRGPETQGAGTATRDGTPVDRPRQAAIRRAARNRPQAKNVVAAYPKLDQFPSPQPLSPEEIALARYVRNFPKEAQLVAQAQEEFELETQKDLNVGTQTGISGSIEQER